LKNLLISAEGKGGRSGKKSLRIQSEKNKSAFPVASDGYLQIEPEPCRRWLVKLP
jgi:hypothetical protein